MTTTTHIPFNDLRAAHADLEPALEAAARRVLTSGWFILGAEVSAFEAEFAAWHGIAHAVGVANGTDAIELALRAGGIGPGDEVITVAHTAVPTVCAVERAGATPVLVDIEADTYTIDPAAVEAAITPRTRAILPVHLYGYPADMPALLRIAEAHGLLLIEDCAQAHGARLNGQRVGTFGHLAAFSFYPTKNLGAIGDGGMVITNDMAYAERLKRLRNYGQVSRYEHAERGINSRLDEMQAALLRVKLPLLDQHNAARRALAAVYDTGLADLPVVRPVVRPGAEHVYHLYVVRSPERDALMERLKARGVQTLIHYAVPVHRQPAYHDLGYAEGSLPVTERVTREIVSLPLHLGLKADDVHTVIEAMKG
ncbi:MAG: DegT/DnrJ/EryC1/StrS family aminotransferase [Chloroflexi bacterium]|nr:DegT/DnrJ/EryC1/StrS family aminotransferase [Chloroflexota bacterium]